MKGEKNVRGKKNRMRPDSNPRRWVGLRNFYEHGMRLKVIPVVSQSLPVLTDSLIIIGSKYSSTASGTKINPHI